MNSGTTSAAAAAELRRLLSVVIANIEAKSIDRSEWWSTEIDTLSDQMRPLWSEIGIAKPGVSVALNKRVIVDPVADPLRPVAWSRSFITRHPDTGAQRQIMLAAGDDSKRFNTTANALQRLLYVVRAWIDWIDSRYQLEKPNPEQVVTRVKVPVSTLARELDTSKQSLYRLEKHGGIEFQGTPKFIYRDQINKTELKRLLDLQAKQQLRGQ